MIVLSTSHLSFSVGDRDILTDIVYPALFTFPFAYCGEFFINAYRLHFLSAHNTAGGFAELRRIPTVVIVSRFGPLAELKTGVVKFAVSDTRHLYRTVGKAFPRRVGNDRFRFAVRI